MAKIAIIAAAVAAGVLISVATGGLGAFAVGSWAADIFAGAAVGAAVGNTVASLALPPHYTYTGPRLLDTQVSGSADGSPIPFGYGGMRLGAQIVWSSGIQETQNQNTQSSKGGPSTTSTTYSYTISFAACPCKGEAAITRIWGDSKLIYDATGKGAITSNTLSTGNGTNTIQVYPAIYKGVETQLPDPTIQAAEGVNGTSAMRDLCYFVYTDFPLADFGNRLPNIRAEVTTGITDAFLKDIIPPGAINDPYGVGGFFPPSWPYVDTVNRCAFIFDEPGMAVQRIDLSADNTGPLDSWQASHVYVVGDEILDSGGNVQLCYQTTGDAESGTTQPTWTNVEGDVIVDHHVNWRNVGEGPEAVVITGQGLINPLPPSGIAFTSFSQVSQHPNGLGVDTAGNLWFSAFVAPDIEAGKQYVFVQVDPNTFQAKRMVASLFPGSSVQFVKTADGQDLVYFFGLSSFTGNNVCTVLDARSGSQKSIDGLNYLQPFPFAQRTSLGTAAVDPQGNAYIISYGSSGTWVINTVNPRAGAGLNTSSVFTESGGSDTARSCLYYGPDHSLIVFTNLGAIHKVDIATMTIISSLPTGTLRAGATHADIVSTAYPSGQVPADGVVHIMGELSGADSLLSFNAASMTVEQNTALTEWSSFISTPLAYAYDPNSVSMLVNDGNQYTYRLYINRQAVAGKPLDEIVVDLFNQAGLTSDKYDVSALSGIIVRGYPVTRTGDAKSILAVLCQAYFFDVVESDYKLKAVLRGGSTAVTIPEEDLGLSDANGAQSYELQTTIAQQQDLPKDITVLYADPAKDYQQGKQTRRRHSKVVKTKNQTLLEVPLTLQSDEAAQIAQKALATAWSERNQYAWKLWKAVYQIIDPSDLVQFTYGSAPYQSRITKTNAGQNRQLEINGCSENSLTYVSTVAGVKGSGFQPSAPLGIPAITSLFLLDLPLLQDTDATSSGSTGFYWGMSSPNNGWPGAVLFGSADNQTFAQLDFSNSELPYGTVSAITPAPRATMSWDFKTKIVVRMSQGTLSSTSVLNVLNGANGFLLGNEVMQFVNATLNGDGTYTLDTFLRGRRGTEWACSEHGPGETFILLNGVGLHRTTTQTALINALRYYKGVTIGQAINSVFPQQFTQQGNDLKPYAVAQLQGATDGSGNMVMTWVRRTRLGGAWLDGTGIVPLAEDIESYDLEVMELSGNGRQDFPNYTVSINPIQGSLKDVSSGGGLVTVSSFQIMPFTVTWDDGHTASYLGHNFDVDADYGDFNTIYHFSVIDPDRTGDAFGGTLSYNFSGDLGSANSAGTVFIGSCAVYTDSRGTVLSPGGTNNVVRTVLGLSSPTWTYPASQIATDFPVLLHFNEPSTFRVRVYQNSAQVGRGFVALNQAMGAGVGSSGGSSDATSINGIAINATAPTDGQVLTYVAGSTDIEWKTPASPLARTSINKTTASLAQNASETGTLTMGAKSFIVLGASTTRDCRIQLYSTSALMTADASRGIGTNPTDGSESGVIMDLVLTAAGSWIASPALLGANMESSPDQTIAYRITNLDTSTGTVPITLTILPLEL